ncbi:Fruit protein [Porphyridium purpureum]|uniref:Fruit protein n=1 Tax=Porphyridium purpureum TaxID=35688 RepID=A0A5J4YNJ8_PORPP|nr:Fruit protein [Porphyridium purpureum]|eukprot:POR3532..scf222_8
MEAFVCGSSGILLRQVTTRASTCGRRGVWAPWTGTRTTWCAAPMRGEVKRARVHVRMATQSEAEWNVVEVVENSRAADGVRYIVVNVGVTAAKGSLCDTYRVPGMFVQVKSNQDPEIKPSFMAMACAPNIQGFFEFLVKEAESTEWFWKNTHKGDKIQMSPVIGKGFAIKPALDLLAFPAIPEESAPKDIIMLATGTGVAPMRAAIESMLNGLNPRARRSVKLYYGARTPAAMPCQDRFKLWKEDNVTVIPVFSESSEGYDASFSAPARQKMYIQAALKEDGISAPKQTGVLMVGQKGMCEEARAILVEAGVPEERILLNF